MGTTSEKLTYLNTTKSNIKDSIELMGTTILSEDTFRSYADKIKKQLKLYLKENSVETLWNKWEKVEGEGETLTLNNTMEGKMKVDLKGNTQQNGTPTPDTPIDIQVVSGNNTIKVEGKNLFDKDNNVIHLVFTEANHILSYNERTISIYIPCSPNTTYTIQKRRTQQFEIGYTTVAPAVDVEVKNIEVGPVGDANINVPVSATYTTNSEAKYLVIRIGYSTQIDVEKLLNVTQIEQGSTASEYTPYVSQTYPISLGNIELCKIGTYQDRIFKSSGKNLLPYPYTITTSPYTNNGITYTINNDGTINVNGTATGRSSISLYGSYLEVNNKTLMGKYIKGGTNKVNMYVFSNGGGTYQVLARDTGQGAEINTSTYKKGYIELVITQGTTVNNELIKPMVLESLEDTTYEPYSNGRKVWYLNKQIGKVVLTGGEDEEWVYQNNARFFLRRNYFTDETVPKNPTTPEKLDGIYCLYFQEKTRGATWIGTEGISYDNINTSSSPIGSTFDIACNSIATTVEAFKTWLSTHNTEVYYLLQNPQNTEITDTTLLSQLEALAYSYEGTTNISQVNDDLASILNVTALEDIS